MRLIFFYLQNKYAEVYFRFFKTEGYFWILKRMLETGVVKEVLVVIDSSQEMLPIKIMEGMTGISVQGIKNISGEVRQDDIIWVRGGWRGWFSFLEELKIRGNKLLLYAANTGRERWGFWDIIFNDLLGEEVIDATGRKHVDFRKPINPEIFYPYKTDMKYDVCIGASRIHDKKGQWRTVKALTEYKKIFGVNLKCILPGNIINGVNTNNILSNIKENDLDIDVVGMVSRDKMNEIYNQSKIFIHLGSGGQGDRGVLEAMRCGCKVIIGFPKYHCPAACHGHTTVLTNPDNMIEIANYLKTVINSYTEDTRKEVITYYEQEFGIENVILPKMKLLFETLRN